MRERTKDPSLGEKMYKAYKNGEKLPGLDAKIDDADCPAANDIKSLMLEMTSYHAKDRPPAAKIIQRVTAITVEAGLDVEVSIKG